jgi:hypothetical protein
VKNVKRIKERFSSKDSFAAVVSPVKKSDHPKSKNLSERSESFFDLDEKKTFLHSRANDRSERSLLENPTTTIVTYNPLMEN